MVVAQGFEEFIRGGVMLRGILVRGEGGWGGGGGVDGLVMGEETCWWVGLG